MQPQDNSLEAIIRSKLFRLQKYARPVGLTLFGVAFLVGLAMTFYGQYFIDESDNLVGGWLVTKGYLPYRDLFTHHFPFPYYWVAVFVRFFGNSVTVVRISLLALQFGLLAISMRITGLYLPIGLTALAWNLVSVFHYGNQVLYDVFSGMFIVSGFMIIFSYLINRRNITSLLLIYLGILVSLAILSDPLMVYPGIILVIALFFSGWRLDRPGETREGLRRALIASGAVVIGFGLYGLYLSLSGTLDDFFQTAIVFNTQVYGSYINFNPNRVGVILQELITGIGIFNPSWRDNLSFTFELNEFIYISVDKTPFYGWIFTSFFYRLAVIVCGFGLLLRGRFAAGLFMYLLSASLLIRVDSGFHAIPFILLSLFAASFVISGDFPHAQHYLAISRKSHETGRHILGILSTIWWAARFIIGFMLIWGGLWSAIFLFGNYETIQDRNGFVPYQLIAKDLKSIACKKPGVELSYFPYNSYVNFRSELPPVSKYIFMLPWVADIGLDEYILALQDHPSAIVYIDRSAVIWDKYPVENYLGELIIFLDDNYFLVRENTWISPELFEACQGITR